MMMIDGAPAMWAICCFAGLAARAQGRLPSATRAGSGSNGGGKVLPPGRETKWSADNDDVHALVVASFHSLRVAYMHMRHALPCRYDGCVLSPDRIGNTVHLSGFCWASLSCVSDDLHDWLYLLHGMPAMPCAGVVGRPVYHARVYAMPTTV